MHLQACYAIVSLLFLMEVQAAATPFGVDYDHTSLGSRAGPDPVRNLRAARTKSSIKARSIEGCLDHQVDLHYLDGTVSLVHGARVLADMFLIPEQTHQTSSQFSARVRMSTRLPTIVLEDIEHHINEITCFDSSIHLYFAGQQNMELAYNEFAVVDEFYVVTSHEGCNNDGEREAHRVSGVYVDEGEQLLILSTSLSPWKDTVHAMTLDFGRNSEHFELRRHRELRPRQAASSSAASAAAAASSTAITSEAMTTASLSTSVTISYPASPSTTPTVTDLSTSLTSATYISQTILPADGLQFSGPEVPDKFSLVCKNCSIYGSIEILSGSLTANLSDDTEFPALKFWEHGGYVELLVNDFSAYLELETTVAVSKDLKIWTSKWPTLGFPYLSIPHIAAVGPQLIPQASMGVKLGAQLTFNYGFSVTVPNNSSITVVVGNLTKSSITNFSNTNITALPFQAEQESISMTLQTGFNPQLLLGGTIFDNVGTIGAGVFFDLPSISAAFSYVNPANASCDSVGISSPDKISNGVLNIVPSVIFDAGLFAEAQISEDGYKIGEVKAHQLTNYTLPLSTVCLSFNTHASTFGPAVKPATTTASSGPQSTSAAVHLTNPLARMVSSMGLGAVLTLSLVLASIIFCALVTYP